MKLTEQEKNMNLKPWYQRYFGWAAELILLAFGFFVAVAIIGFVLLVGVALPTAFWAVFGAGVAALGGWDIATAAAIGAIVGFILGVLSMIKRAVDSA